MVTPGSHMLDQHVETFGDQPPGLAHALEGILAVQLDLAGFSERRGGRFNVGHGAVNLRIEGGKASGESYQRGVGVEALPRLWIAARFCRAHRPMPLTGSSSERPSLVSS